MSKRKSAKQNASRFFVVTNLMVRPANDRVQRDALHRTPSPSLIRRSKGRTCDCHGVCGFFARLLVSVQGTHAATTIYERRTPNFPTARSSDRICRRAVITNAAFWQGSRRAPIRTSMRKNQWDPIPTRGRQEYPPCWPPLGRPRSDTAFAQGEAVPSSNAPERCAILIAHTIGLPDVGLTFQTSLIYNHIFVNSQRTKYE